MEGERREIIGIQTMEQGCWEIEGARIRTSLPVKWEEEGGDPYGCRSTCSPGGQEVDNLISFQLN